MQRLQNLRKVQIVYFSGTGGTAKVALAFEKEFVKREIEVAMVSLNMYEDEKVTRVDESVDLLLIVFPVHAFDAPQIVYEWLEKVSLKQGLPCGVISVSAGGEKWPNTACRIGCIELLEKKGVNVFYERMMVMPSNFMTGTKEQLAIGLLKILPSKVEHCVNELLEGIARRTKKPFALKLIAFISQMEKKNSYRFGKDLCATDKCIGCGRCQSKCPVKNITLLGGKPSFNDRCIMCFGCAYRCPVKAIKSKHYGVVLIKEGYDLNKLEEKAGQIKELSLDDVKFGLAYIELKKYLSEISR